MSDLPLEIVTFGETMIRLNPPNHGRLDSCSSLDLRIGGSESNTAAALSILGRRVGWFSRLPDNALGRRIAWQVGRWGVDTSRVIWRPGERAGLYFVEFGSPPRPHHVLYDRANSAASKMEPADLDLTWMCQARHLHVTGITMALSKSCRETVIKAVREAKERQMTVSLDVNYRSKLWSPAEAKEAISGVMRWVDLLFCPLGDANQVFGVQGSPPEVARQLQRIHGVQTIVVTGHPQYVAAIHGRDIVKADVVFAREIDRVGSGDAGDAGILHGYLSGDIQKGLRYGCAMAALKQTVPGDELTVTKAEIEAVVGGGGLGIQR